MAQRRDGKIVKKEEFKELSSGRNKNKINSSIDFVTIQLVRDESLKHTQIHY